MKQWFGLGMASGLVLVLIAACGQEVCIFGQGDCAQDLQSTTLTLKASATTVGTGDNITFTPSGGTKPYTSYTILVGSGNNATVNPSSGDSTVFTAGDATGTACVRVTDTSNNTADRCVTVN